MKIVNLLIAVALITGFSACASTDNSSSSSADPVRNPPSYSCGANQCECDMNDPTSCVGMWEACAGSQHPPGQPNKACNVDERCVCTRRSMR
jgi:hypothetical protein